MSVYVTDAGYRQLMERRELLTEIIIERARVACDASPELGHLSQLCHAVKLRDQVDAALRDYVDQRVQVRS